jgi:acyl carrier protein
MLWRLQALPDSLLVRLEALAREVFQDSKLKLTPSTIASDVAGWDSLGHVNFMYSIEQEFDVIFTDQEFTSAANVGALQNLLVQKGVAA